MTALEVFASAIADHGRVRPSAAVRELVALHLIDTVGAWIASTRTAEGQALLRHRAALRQGGHAGDAVALDLLTRCALARMSEIDDIHLTSTTTPGAIVVPSALTLAAARPDTSAADVIAAILAGYEAMTRLGRAIDGSSVLYRGIWPTCFAAPFAVAAVAARLMKLDVGATANALALALTLAAPGVGHHNAPTTSRWFAVGHAARNGLAAALAAREEFTSDLGLIEGDFLYGLYEIRPDVDALAEGLGKRPALADVSFKPWCAARQTMAATQALREIIASGVELASIDKVHASVLKPHHRMIDHGLKDDRASYLTSVRYCMAVAALSSDSMALDELSPASVPPPVRAFMRKIIVQTDDRLLAKFPRAWPAHVYVTAGSVEHERLVTHVPGDPRRPFDQTQVREKFLRFVLPVIGAEKAERVLDRCGDALPTSGFATLVGDVEAAIE